MTLNLLRLIRDRVEEEQTDVQYIEGECLYAQRDKALQFLGITYEEWMNAVLNKKK